MKEKDVEDICRKIAIEEGFVQYSLEGKKGSDGVADIMLIDPAGLDIFFEIKLDSELRQNQKLFLAKVRWSFELRWDRKSKQPLVRLNPYYEVGFREYLQHYRKYVDR